MTENDKQHQLESVTTESQPSVEQFPTENFVCPACGQLLGPACRVCVACKRAIDPAELRKPQVLPAIAMPERRELEPVRFSWRTFVIVFAIWVVGATLVQSRMPPTRAQLVLGGVQILVPYGYCSMPCKRACPDLSGGGWEPCFCGRSFSPGTWLEESAPASPARSSKDASARGR